MLLTSRELTGEVFDAIKDINSFISIAIINAELNGELGDEVFTLN